jgi:hypothetical protein
MMEDKVKSIFKQRLHHQSHVVFRRVAIRTCLNVVTSTRPGRQLIPKPLYLEHVRFEREDNVREQQLIPRHQQPALRIELRPLVEWEVGVGRLACPVLPHRGNFELQLALARCRL